MIKKFLIVSSEVYLASSAPASLVDMDSCHELFLTIDDLNAVKKMLSRIDYLRSIGTNPIDAKLEYKKLYHFCRSRAVQEASREWFQKSSV